MHLIRRTGAHLVLRDLGMNWSVEAGGQAFEGYPGVALALALRHVWSH